MVRSTKTEKARQVNAARGLLRRGIELPEAVRRLSREFDLSERQAYRYLEEASQLDRPIEIPEATVSVTLKLPPRTVELLRKYAKSSGLTIGAIVTAALNAFLRTPKRSWLSRIERAAIFKSMFPIRLIACSRRSLRRLTRFWSHVVSAPLARA